MRSHARSARWISVGLVVAALGGCGGASAGGEHGEPPVGRAPRRGQAACEAGAPGVDEETAAEAMDEDDPARLEAHERACTLGNPCGCDALADLLVSSEPGRARPLYRRACEAGLEPSCVAWGLLLRDGEGGDADLAHAATLFADACRARDPLGCASEADLLLTSRSPSELGESVLEPYRLACDGGVPWACYQAAHLSLELAPELSSDVVEAVLAHDAMACDHDVPLACTHRARMLAREGSGVPREDVDALFARACEGGEAWGCTFLGQRLVRGGGERARAIELFTRACDGGNGVACRSLAGELQGEERAQRMARACELQDAEACDAVALPPRGGELPAGLAGDASGAAHASLDARGATTSLEVQAGGSLDVASLELRPSCVGFVESAPDAVVSLPARVPEVRVRLTSLADATLVVRGPDGVIHCADNAADGSFDAEIIVPVGPGELQIWAGRRDGSAPRAATLAVTAVATTASQTRGRSRAASRRP